MEEYQGLVKYLINHDADLFKENKFGYSSLNYALKSNNQNIISCFNDQINYLYSFKKSLPLLLEGKIELKYNI